MVRLAGTFSRLGRSTVLVMGDFFLDTYTVGKASRISPEAPVAVIQVQREEHRPGGAGNVVLNLISLGLEVIAVGRIGEDTAGDQLLQALTTEGVDISGIVRQKGYKTPVKNRIIAENQQIVRVDHETITPLPEALEKQLIQILSELICNVKVLAISDYGKGTLSRSLLAEAIDKGKKQGIPIIADPKGVDFTKYHGVTVIKPNFKEAVAASGLSSDSPLESIASQVLQKVQADILMMTRSEFGISVFHRAGTRTDFPVRVKEVKDVTGAGDTVLATLTCAIANGLSINEAAQLCNISAGIAIEHFGCARVNLAELARRLLEYDVVNKVFDEEHLYALQNVLKGTAFTLLGIHSKEGFTPAIFNAVRRLASARENDLLVYVRDSNPSDEFIDILTSLREVNFVILRTENLRHLCRMIEPTEVYVLEENHLRNLKHSNSLFEANA